MVLSSSIPRIAKYLVRQVKKSSTSAPHPGRIGGGEMEIAPCCVARKITAPHQHPHRFWETTITTTQLVSLTISSSAQIVLASWTCSALCVTQHLRESLRAETETKVRVRERERMKYYYIREGGKQITLEFVIKTKIKMDEAEEIKIDG